MARHPGGLVQPLMSGELDLIADVHGEIRALEALLKHLGYDCSGRHPDGRRLVFLGDLINRGPDSPTVVRLVQRLITAGRAQCVLGNHELNLLRGRDRGKVNSHWFYGTGARDNPLCASQARLPIAEQRLLLTFFSSLPLALEREDLRVIHACWHAESIAAVRRIDRLLPALEERDQQIRAQFDAAGITDKTRRALALQNRNPIKVLTSGPEEAVPRRAETGSPLWGAARSPWWETYTDPVVCIFGHYSRTKPKAPRINRLPMFPPDRPYAALGAGNALCIDYAVGARPAARVAGQSLVRYELAALRWPEAELVFDNGRREVVTGLRCR